MDIFYHYFYDFFLAKGFSPSIAEGLHLVVSFILLSVLSFIIYQTIRKVILNFFKRLAQKSKTRFDDYLVKNKTFDYVGHIIPILILQWVIPKLFITFSKAEYIFSVCITILIIVLFIWIIRSILRTSSDFLKSIPSFKDKPIDSYVQVFMIFIWILGITFIFSTLTGKSVFTFLTALGAMSAVILLIFKDTILGFVASIQVAVNDTVRIGDWITMDKYGADGDVIEINLSSVKVQNFDKTITTIPTYHLTSESFRNWRGMLDAGGRRIKRSILIKASSIKFLSTEEINELQHISIIKDLVKDAAETIDSHNLTHQIDKNKLINGRNLSNIGVFRLYIETYLKQHSFINKEMMIMCRQLPSTIQGTPIEIYAFSNDKEWKNYEKIVGDIFDHLLASIPYFYLEIMELDYPIKKESNTL